MAEVDNSIPDWPGVVAVGTEAGTLRGTGSSSEDEELYAFINLCRVRTFEKSSRAFKYTHDVSCPFFARLPRDLFLTPPSEDVVEKFAPNISTILLELVGDG